MASYLSDSYGKFGIIITRNSEKEPHKEKELRWVREFYWTDKKLILPLSAKWIVDFLSKLRTPQKHAAVDDQLGKILDAYEMQGIT